MKNYELTVLFHPDLEMNLDPAIAKVKKILDQAGAKITNELNDGKKRTAYTLKGQSFAVYYYIGLELSPEAPKKISDVFNITDEILRYILVKVDPRKAKLEARRNAKATTKTDEEKEEKGE